MTNQYSGEESPHWINIELDYIAYVKEIMILFPQGYCPTSGCDPNETPLQLRVGFDSDPSNNPVCNVITYNGFYTCDKSGSYVGLWTENNAWIEVTELLVFGW